MPTKLGPPLCRFIVTEGKIKVLRQATTQSQPAILRARKKLRLFRGKRRPDAKDKVGQSLILLQTTGSTQAISRMVAAGERS